MTWWMTKMHSWRLQNPDDGNGNQLPGGGGGGDGGAGGSGDGGQGGSGDGGKGGDDGKGGQGGSGDDGKPKLTDNEAKLLKEVMQKKDALKDAQTKLDEANARLKAFEGIDPAEVRKLLDEKKAAETAQLEAKGEYERVKARMAEEHANQIQAKDAQIQERDTTITKLQAQIADLTVGQQFSQSQFIGEELTLTPAKARVVYGDHFDIVDGKVVAYDKPRGAANRTPLVDQLGNNLAFDDALRKIVEADPDKDHLIRSKVKPGAGSDSNAKADVGKKLNTEGMDSIDKISAGLKGLNLQASTKLL